MPTIYDNIKQDLLAGLTDALSVAKRGDFCVGYFNLRGWRLLARGTTQIQPPPNEPACRLIVGMHNTGSRAVRHFYGNNAEITQGQVVENKKHYAKSLRRQLTLGLPTAEDEKGLRDLQKQLRSGALKVRFFGAYPLHAKLYLAHRDDKLNPITAFVGSSNLTFAGMQKQGELNVDVLDKDAAKKLADWFEERWNDNWCLDISEELADILQESWAGLHIPPYEIYLKAVYELSREAIEGADDFPLPANFRGRMLDFQAQAVSLAAQRLRQWSGVMISDVVGLGKTLVASAVAKTFQEEQGGSVLVICPPKLREMWKEYLHKYEIPGTTFSIGKTATLKKERDYRLVIIDESHNLRNRQSKRHGQIKDYLDKHGSHLILLTATPFNKEFADIGSQLRLFLDENDDLGIRPENEITDCGGILNFKDKHQAMPSSLAAFEKSDKADDWRDLMKMFMVRRTRSHIKENYADYDEERKRHYLTFPNGRDRFYFPERTAKSARFEMHEKDTADQYAMLYSEQIADGVIGELALPRYGLGGYLLSEFQSAKLPPELESDEAQTIKNLNRAGKHLIGFARSGLFKRLESSGYAFLLSVRRHIIRNAVYLAAFDAEDGELPVGRTIDIIDNTDDDDEILTDINDYGENTLDELLQTGKTICGRISAKDIRGKYRWVKTNRFDDTLRKELHNDCKKLMRVFAKVPKWQAQKDRKLTKLHDLCTKEHPGEKMLIFTQFADTAHYLHAELQKLGITKMAKVIGGDDANKMQNTVRLFSPESNNSTSDIDDLRILIATDTLSEGQNLQDARIVVNFDLPWAIVRLIQRAGRVDRIGQKADEILCYCFLPEDGVDKIITLRERLQRRITDNAELVGCDETFFEGNTVNLHHVYNETLSLESDDDDTDFISKCHDIWRRATADDEALRERIKKMGKLVSSAKSTNKGQAPGVLAYIKTGDKRHILAQIGDSGEVLSQSQSAILQMMECRPEEPREKPPDNHHELVARAAEHAKEAIGIGGQLGTKGSIRRILYNRLRYLTEKRRGTLLPITTALKKVVQEIYRCPLQAEAQNTLNRKIRAGITDDELAKNAIRMHDNNQLLIPAATGDKKEAEIICSMALVKKQ